MLLELIDNDKKICPSYFLQSWITLRFNLIWNVVGWK